MISTPLIQAQALKQLIGKADLTIFDASWYMPADQRATRREYLHGHLPGAQFFDIEELSDRATDLPHMLPAAADFERWLRLAGVKQGQPVVVYDSAGIFSAPRAWWMLRTFGISQVAVLDGGLPAWLAAGGTLDVGQPEVGAGDVRLQPAGEQVIDLATLRRYPADGGRQIIDARAAARFTGEAADPRAGVAPGHIPGSRNLPFSQLLEASGHLKDPAALRDAFITAGADLDRPLTASCGSGVTAAVLLLALTTLGHTDLQLYDGSWAEWGADPTTDKALGPA